jgi:hypothetical protein
MKRFECLFLLAAWMHDTVSMETQVQALNSTQRIMCSRKAALKNVYSRGSRKLNGSLHIELDQMLLPLLSETDVALATYS